MSNHFRLHRINSTETLSLTAVYNGKYSDGVREMEEFLRRNPPSKIEMVKNTFLEFLIRNNGASTVREAYIKSGIVPKVLRCNSIN